MTPNIIVGSHIKEKVVASSKICGYSWSE